MTLSGDNSGFDKEMADVLRQLELLSHGSVSAWNASGGQSGEPDDRIVDQVITAEDPPHIRWRIVYQRQHTDAGRIAVIQDAKKELGMWKGTVERPRFEGKPLAEMVLEHPGWEPRMVAQRYGVDEGFVRRKRLNAGLGTEDGRPLLPDVVLADRAGRARELRRQGASTRQIAETLGVTQSAVMKWIRRTAA